MYVDRWSISVYGIVVNVPFYKPGLPDGLFSNQKSQFVLIYFKDIWNILWTFGIYYDPSVHKYCTHLVQLSILVFGTEKNLATLLQTSITAYVVPDLSTKMYFWQVHSGNLNVDSI
jgi:hypothetical protein